jgi:cytochrome c oxidase assembly protein subunit 15
MTADGEYLPFDALTAIHWTHRTFAFVVAAFLGWVAMKAYRMEGLKPTARAIIGALALQIGIGIATVSLKWPLALAVAHNGTAALLVLLVVMLNYKTRISGQSSAHRE